jgi:uncharacterized damage-inducible protein DinB
MGREKFYPMLDAFRMLARYNTIANVRLYEQCGKLDLEEYRRERRGSFGSIHALLNHILLGDRIWMSRFGGGGNTTPPLNSILFETFAKLSSARIEQDASIEAFFEKVDDDFLARSISYTNSRGENYVETAPVAVLHLFNHQTHHRGQVHVMLSQTDVKPPSLDMHRILNP